MFGLSLISAGEGTGRSKGEADGEGGFLPDDEGGGGGGGRLLDFKLEEEETERRLGDAGVADSELDVRARGVDGEGTCSDIRRDDNSELSTARDSNLDRRFFTAGVGELSMFEVSIILEI